MVEVVFLHVQTSNPISMKPIINKPATAQKLDEYAKLLTQFENELDGYKRRLSDTALTLDQYVATLSEAWKTLSNAEWILMQLQRISTGKNPA